LEILQDRKLLEPGNTVVVFRSFSAGDTMIGRLVSRAATDRQMNVHGANHPQETQNTRFVLKYFRISGTLKK
jgi:hypothetical protein